MSTRPGTAPLRILGASLLALAAAGALAVPTTIAPAPTAPVKSTTTSATMTKGGLAKDVAEIVARNAAARGGLAAWHKVHTMVWVGHTAPADPSAQSMPFIMQLKRPNLVRFEIQGQGGQFTRVFDGKQGWKLRPASDGRPDLKPFSPEEVAFAREEFVIDGPLIDPEATDVKVTFDGFDNFEGHTAYRLTLKLPSGAERNLWIDTKTNLDVRYDRPSGSPLQPGARVSTYYRDYFVVEGLKVPRSIEVGAAQGFEPPAKPDKLVIDKVVVNPELNEQAFVRPTTPRQRGSRGGFGAGTGQMPAVPQP